MPGRPAYDGSCRATWAQRGDCKEHSGAPGACRSLDPTPDLVMAPASGSGSRNPEYTFGIFLTGLLQCEGISIGPAGNFPGPCPASLSMYPPGAIHENVMRLAVDTANPEVAQASSRIRTDNAVYDRALQRFAERAQLFTI